MFSQYRYYYCNFTNIFVNLESSITVILNGIIKDLSFMLWKFKVEQATKWLYVIFVHKVNVYFS